MDDRFFKGLKHNCEGYEVYSTGKLIQKSYSPDFVLRSGNEYIILEHETQPNRKTIVADIFKAGYFLQNEKRGVLIIIMTPKGKSSFNSYPKHVVNYYKWIREQTNLIDVIFLQEDLYYYNDLLMIINDEDFISKSISLRSMV